MQELHEQFAGRDDFAFVSVSADGTLSMDRLRPLIQKHGISYPVLHGLDGERPDLHDWQIHTFPSAFLINPQGVIFLETHISPDFADKLQALLAIESDIPVTEIGMSHELLADGSHRLRITASQPLEVQISAAKTLNEYWAEMDGEFQQVDNPPAGVEANMSANWSIEEWDGKQVNLAPDDSGGAYFEFTLDPILDENLWAVQCSVQALVPGLESAALLLPRLYAEALWIKPDSDT